MNRRNVTKARGVAGRAKELRTENTHLSLKVAILEEEIRQLGDEDNLISKTFEDVFGGRA